MKYETSRVAIKGLVGLKLKMYSILVDNNSKHKKAEVNKNVAVKKAIMNTRMIC